MLYAQIKTDLIAAQRKGDSFLVGVLKLVLSELSYAQVEFKGVDLPDTEVLKVLNKEAKKRKDSIELYTKIGAADRAETEMKELAVIDDYLPQLMGEDKVRFEVARIASETGFVGGRLIGAAMKELTGKADGSLVQRVVNEGFLA
jgi:uncharacterized protein